MNALKNLYATVFGLFAMLMTGLAHATVDPAVKTAFDGVKADATELSGIVTPIVISILGLALTIKLIKRFASKI